MSNANRTSSPDWAATSAGWSPAIIVVRMVPYNSSSVNRLPSGPRPTTPLDRHRRKVRDDQRGSGVEVDGYAGSSLSRVQRTTGDGGQYIDEQLFHQVAYPFISFQCSPSGTHQMNLDAMIAGALASWHCADEASYPPAATWTTTGHVLGGLRDQLSGQGGGTGRCDSRAPPWPTDHFGPSACASADLLRPQRRARDVVFTGMPAGSSR